MTSNSPATRAAPGSTLFDRLAAAAPWLLAYQPALLLSAAAVCGTLQYLNAVVVGGNSVDTGAVWIAGLTIPLSLRWMVLVDRRLGVQHREPLWSVGASMLALIAMHAPNFVALAMCREDHWAIVTLVALGLWASMQFQWEVGRAIGVPARASYVAFGVGALAWLSVGLSLFLLAAEIVSAWYLLVGAAAMGILIALFARQKAHRLGGLYAIDVVALAMPFALGMHVVGPALTRWPWVAVAASGYLLLTPAIVRARRWLATLPE